jgi:hypothetical protein
MRDDLNELNLSFLFLKASAKGAVADKLALPVSIALVVLAVAIACWLLFR